MATKFSYECVRDGANDSNKIKSIPAITEIILKSKCFWSFPIQRQLFHTLTPNAPIFRIDSTVNTAVNTVLNILKTFSYSGELP